MLFKHYKGGLYRVLVKNAYHSETQEEMVVYTSVETGEVYVRPHDMFFESVETTDGLVPRFDWIRE